MCISNIPVSILRRCSIGVSAVAVTPDGKQVVLTSWESSLKVWDLEQGVEMGVMQAHIDRVHVMLITTEGTKVVSRSADKTLRV